MGFGPASKDEKGGKDSGKDAPFNPPPQPKKPEVEDPNKLKEKKAQADLLFGNLTFNSGKPMATGTKPTGATTTAPAPPPGGLFAGTKPAQPPMNWGAKPPSTTTTTTTQAAPSQPQKNQPVDLLDLDFGGPPAPAPVQQPKPAPAPMNAFNMFSGQPQASAAAPPFQSLQLQLSDFETYWGNITLEKEDRAKGQLRNEAEARQIIHKIGFYVISVNGNEVISSGKTAANEIVLLYLQFDPSGNLELRVRSANQKTIQDALNAFKSALGGGSPAPAPAQTIQQKQPSQPVISDSLI